MKYRLTRTIAYTKSPYAIAASPDGKWVGVTCFDQKLRVYDTATFTERKAIHLGTSFPHTCAFTTDSVHVIGGGKAMAFFDLQKFKKGLTLKGHRDEIHCLALSSDGKHAATSSGANVVGADCTVRTWEVATAKELARWKAAPNDTVFGVALSQDGKLVIGCTQGGDVLAGPPTAKAPAWKITWESWLYAIAVAPAGDEVWVGGDPDELAVLSTHDGKVLRTMKSDGSTRRLRFLPDGKHVVLGVQRYQGKHCGRVRVLDLKGKAVWSSDIVARMIADVAVNPDGATLYAITSDPDAVLVFARD